MIFNSISIYVLIKGYGMVAMEEWRMKTNGEVISTGLPFYKIPEVGNLPRDFNVTLLSDSPNKEAIVYSSKVSSTVVLDLNLWFLQ